jgi:hypothetical protein
MAFSDLANFEKLIAPTIIKIVYWIGIVGIALFGLIGIGGILFAGESAVNLLWVILGVVFGLLFWRIICELYIVIFGMYERLGAIRDQLRPGGTPR